MAKSVSISNVTLTEANPAVSAIMPAYTYLRDMSVVNFSFTCKWSGFSKVTNIEPVVGIHTSSTSYQAFAWLLAKEEKTTATSGTKTYSGQMFVPQLSGGYSPGLTSLADGTYWIKFDFTVWNGNSGFGLESETTFQINYRTLKAPTAEVFDLYRATSTGARSDEGTYIRYSVRASITQTMPTDRASFVLWYRRSGTSSWSTISLGSNVTSVNVTGVQLPGTYPISTSCEFELVIVDNYNTVTIPKLVPTASVLMHFKSDKTGIGVGKYSEISNLLDVNLATRFRQAITFDAPAVQSIENAVPSRGLSYPVTSIRTAVDIDHMLPITLSIPGGEYDPAVVTPTLVSASAPHCYAFRINKAGYYMLSMSWLAATTGSDANTTSNSQNKIFVCSSLSNIPTTVANSVVGGVTEGLVRGAPSTFYRLVRTYTAAPTSTTSSGSASGVVYIPQNYYVAFYVYLRSIRKDLSDGAIGIALL